MQLVVEDIPGQRFGQVVDLVAQRVEALVQRLRAAGFGAVQLGVGPCEVVRLAAVDLATVAAVFIDHGRTQAGSNQGLGAAYA
ncbi:hypothetical protein D3C72_2120210 [compost metagenome]